MSNVYWKLIRGKVEHRFVVTTVCPCLLSHWCVHILEDTKALPENDVKRQKVILTFTPESWPRETAATALLAAIFEDTITLESFQNLLTRKIYCWAPDIQQQRLVVSVKTNGACVYLITAIFTPIQILPYFSCGFCESWKWVGWWWWCWWGTQSQVMI